MCIRDRLKIVGIHGSLPLADMLYLQDPGRATVQQLKDVLRKFSWSVSDRKADLEERVTALQKICNLLDREGWLA